MLTSKTVSDFLTETASNSPAPGGGSVSALAAALGTALTSMVCRLTIGKKKYADVQTEIEAVLLKSESLREKSAALIDEDTFAFNKVMAAFALPKETEDQKSARSAAIQEATKGATLVPMQLMELCADAMPLVRMVAEKGNQNSLSDAGVAALMLSAACEGAAFNVKINLGSINDSEFVSTLRSKTDALLRSVQSSAQEISARVHAAFAG